MKVTYQTSDYEKTDNRDARVCSHLFPSFFIICHPSYRKFKDPEFVVETYSTKETIASQQCTPPLPRELFYIKKYGSVLCII